MLTDNKRRTYGTTRCNTYCYQVCAEQLKNLSPERKVKLAHSLKERVPSGLASIEEWNELLKLFMDAPPEIENKIAKKKLLCFLRGEEYKEENAENNEKKRRLFGRKR